MTRASRVIGLVALLAVLLVARSVWVADEPHALRHTEPGNFDYYVLVLSWSPTYCLHEGGARNDPQCDSEQSHDFVLHGL